MDITAVESLAGVVPPTEAVETAVVLIVSVVVFAELSAERVTGRHCLPPTTTLTTTG